MPHAFARRWRPTALALAVLALGQPAFAQTAEPAAGEPQRITVTGSNIKRTDVEGVSPIEVITREELQRSGYTAITNVLRTLTAAGGGGVSDLDGSNSFSAGASSVSLRSLGSQATLVLLNGRRVAPFAPADPNVGQASFVNLDSLPFEVIDRIEILKDGASAIYGSEAIAGVVNIITRSEFTGGLVSGTASVNTRGNYPTQAGTFTYGFGDLDRDGYNVFGSLEISRRERTGFTDEQSWLIDKRFTSSLFYRTGDPLFSSYAGNYYAAAFDPATLGSAFYFFFLEPRADCPESQIDSAGRCRFNIWPYIEIESPSDRLNLLTVGTLKLSPQTQAYVELGYNRTKTTFTGAPQVWGDFGSWFAAGSGTIVNVPEVLPIDHPNNNFPDNPFGLAELGYRHRFSEVGPRVTETLMQATRVVAGVRGEAIGWDYDSAVSYSENRYKSTQNNEISASTLTRGILDGTYNFQDPFSGAITPDDLRLSTTDTARSSYLMLDLKGSRQIGTLAGGPAAVAVGAEVRREERVATPDANKLIGEVLGFGAASADGTRSVGTLFSEFSLPLVKDLEIQAAARLDRYSDYGNSVNPKLGVKWRASPSLALRGSWQTGFRAPSLTEIADSDVSAFTTVLDPKRCVIGTEDDCFGTGIGVLIAANPDLKPEKSRGLNFGVIWEPVPGLSMTFDYFNIERRNEVDTLSLDEIIANEDSTDPRYAGRVVRAPADPNNPGVPGPIQTVTTGYFNLGSTETSGIDIDAQAVVPLGDMGRLRLGAEMTYTFVYREQAVAGSPKINYRGYWNQPKWRGRASAGWERDGLTVTLSANATGRYATFSPPEVDATGAEDCQDPAGVYVGICAVGTWTTYDLAFSYSGIKDLELGFVIRNLADRKPPADPNWYSTPAFNNDYHSGSGRQYTLSASYKF